MCVSRSILTERTTLPLAAGAWVCDSGADPRRRCLSPHLGKRRRLRGRTEPALGECAPA
ncbi:hypothetical protein [Streptomyces filipinensis]